MNPQYTDKQQIEMQVNNTLANNIPNMVPLGHNATSNNFAGGIQGGPVPNMPIIVDLNGDFAAPVPQLNELRYQQSSMHVRSLIANLIFFAGLATGLAIYLTSPQTLSLGGMIAIIVSSYLFYLLLACICNQLLEYFSKISHGVTFQTQYNNVRKLVGSFQLNATCYHYETRHHTRWVSDGHGGGHSQHYTTTQKVVTHTDHQTVTPPRTEDVSGQVGQIRAIKTMIFIDFQVSHRFVNNASQYVFDSIYSSFKSRNTRDVHQDFSCQYVIPGLIDKQAFYIGELNCNYQILLLIFGLFGLIWPYSIWVEQKVERFSLPITKMLTF